MSSVTRIKELAKEKGVRMGYIYEKLGCSRSKFTNVETGLSSISDREYIILADILGTTIEYLKGETDQKERPSDATMDVAGSEDELKLRKILAKLDDDSLDLLLKIADQLLEKQNKENHHE